MHRTFIATFLLFLFAGCTGREGFTFLPRPTEASMASVLGSELLPLNFKPTLVGQTDTILIEFTNTGETQTSDSRISGAMGPIAFEGSECLTVKPGHTCRIKAIFSPIVAGSFKTTMTLSFFDGISVKEKAVAVQGLAYQIPKVTFNPSPAVTSTNQSSYSLSGSCSEVGQPVAISGSVNGAATCGADGKWSMVRDLSLLLDGTLTVYANHRNTFDYSAARATLSLIKDATGIALTLNALASITSQNVSTYPISGSCSEVGTLQVSGVTLVCGPSGFSSTLNLSALADGNVTLVFTTIDVNGNQQSFPFNIIKDTTPPAPFSLTGPASPFLMGGSPVIQMSSTVGASVLELKISNTSTCTSPLNTYTGTSPAFNVGILPVGTYYFCGKQTDAFGNFRLSSNVFVLTIIPPVQLLGVTPSIGSLNGGDTLTFSGSNLSSLVSVNSITIGGSTCSNIAQNNTLQTISCQTSANAVEGTYPITVTFSSGQTLSNLQFTYSGAIPSPADSSFDLSKITGVPNQGSIDSWTNPIVVDTGKNPAITLGQTAIGAGAAGTLHGYFGSNQAGYRGNATVADPYRLSSSVTGTYMSLGNQLGTKAVSLWFNPGYNQWGSGYTGTLFSIVGVFHAEMRDRRLQVGDFTTPVSDTWHHLAFSKSGNETIVYLDGVEVFRTTASLGSGVATPNGVAALGSSLYYNAGGWNQFSGSFAKFDSWQAPLNSRQVNTLYLNDRTRFYSDPGAPKGTRLVPAIANAGTSNLPVITLYGWHLKDITNVQVGGTNASSITVLADNKITFVPPFQSSVGFQDVTLFTLQGASYNVPKAFFYTAGPLNGATSLFDAANTNSVGAAGASANTLDRFPAWASLTHFQSGTGFNATPSATFFGGLGLTANPFRVLDTRYIEVGAKNAQSYTVFYRRLGAIAGNSDQYLFSRCTEGGGFYGYHVRYGAYIHYDSALNTDTLIVKRETDSVSIPIPLNDTGWHHVTYSNSGSLVKIYRDGVEVAQMTSQIAPDINLPLDRLYFGNAGCDFDWQMNPLMLNGNIIQAGTYDRELSGLEIQTLYQEALQRVQ